MWYEKTRIENNGTYKNLVCEIYFLKGTPKNAREEKTTNRYVHCIKIPVMLYFIRKY